MIKFDPARYSHNYAERSIRRSTSLPLPVSFTDQAFLDQVAETTKIFYVKKRVLPGPVMKTEEDWKWKGKKCSTELNTIIRERKKELKEKEVKDKNVLQRGGERQLWGSADWREGEKDLNHSFSKLSPIRSGRRAVRGRAECFVLNN
jgi:hypothetical protein